MSPTFREQLVALLSLTFVSTAIGFTMKVSVNKYNRYDYSPVSAVAMTELFKLLASLIIVSKLIRDESKEHEISFAVALVNFARRNVAWRVFFHNLGLALAYAVVNLVTFGVLTASPASMFFLIKAASPVVTALLLAVMVHRPISLLQWIAIFMQTVAIFVTQFDPCHSAPALSVYVYTLILINMIVGCAAGVWNEHIIKDFQVSINAQNVLMYACGVLINVALFFVFPANFIGGSSNTGFFENYGWPVIAVIAANGCVGLVITAVYKYADVVVKTFGSATSTACLFILEFTNFIPNSNTKVPRVEQFFAAVIIFYAAYVYIMPTSPLENDEAASTDQSVAQRLRRVLRDARAQILVVMLIAALSSLAITAASCPPDKIKALHRN